MTSATRSVVLVVHAVPSAEASGTPLVADGYARELARRGWTVTVLHAALPGEGSWEDVRVVRAPGEPYRQVVVPRFAVTEATWSLEGFSETFPGPTTDSAQAGSERVEVVEQILRRLDPALMHVVDLVHLPMWVPELAHRMGIPVVRSVSCAEDLCTHIAPLGPGSGPSGFCPAPLTVERCAECVWRGTNRAFGLHLPTGDPAVDARRRARLVELLTVKRDRAREQFGGVYDRVVFASRQFREYFEGTLPLDAARVRVLPMGVGLETPARRELVRAREADRLRFVFASTADPVKGVDAVVDAFSHPEVSGRDDWQLLLAGGGDRSQFGELRTDPRVTDHGSYAQEELAQLLAGADVGLSTSYFETFHRVTREYLLAGLPVIGSHAFGVTDVVVDGVNGVIFDHAEQGSLRRAIIGLLDDRSRVANLARGAVATRVRTVADEVDELEVLYAELAGPRNGHRGANGARDADRMALSPVGAQRDPGDAGGGTVRAPLVEPGGSAPPGGVPPAVSGSGAGLQHLGNGGAGGNGGNGVHPPPTEVGVRGDPLQRAGEIADELIRSLRPATVFGVGASAASLVQALVDRGVEARGCEWSPDARPRVPGDGPAAADPENPSASIPGRYDLVVCVGVADHLAPADAEILIDLLTSASDRVLVAPSPGWEAGSDDARGAVRWLRAFARRGFAPVLGHDPSYVDPEAVLFEWAGGPVADDQLLGAAALVRARSEAAVTRDELERVRGELASLLSQATADRIKSYQVEKRFLGIVHELELQRGAAASASQVVEAFKATKIIRYSRPARSFYGWARKFTTSALKAAPQPAEAPVPDDTTDRYALWVRLFDSMNDDQRARLVGQLDCLDHQPLVSVVMPVYNPPEHFLRAAIDSVRRQVYENWELCVVDDGSTAPWVAPVLEQYRSLDSRIRTMRRPTNGHISAASNTALEMAGGEWVALLDHDDELSEHALALAVLALARQPDARLLYSDEDKIDETGRRFGPFFKPDFDPLLLLGQNYLCHMTMLRRDLAEEIGGFRVGFEGSQDWDLVLRASERLSPGQVAHVPHVLYHWRAHSGSTALDLSEKSYWPVASTRAVREHLERQGRPGEVTVNRAVGVLRVRWPLPEDPPLVSIIIPTRDGKYLRRCLQSLLAWTDYSNFEVIVVDNGSQQPETAAILEENARWIRVIRDERPFNYSALNNMAVRECTGEVLCLLNDDCEVTEYGWLAEMVSQVCQEGVGAVGAKLLYPDDRIQHAGVLLGVGGVAGHAHRLSERVATGHFGWLFTARTLSAVTAACMVVRRSVFEEIGGFDEEHLAISLNDVDLCLRIGRAGWRVVWTPFSVLVHYESVSRGHDSIVRPEAHSLERRFMMERWADLLLRDPAFNPNLTLDSTGGIEFTGEQFCLAFPPREPWWAE